MIKIAARIAENIQPSYQATTEEIISHLIQWQNAKYTIDVAYRNFADRLKAPWRDSVYDHWYEHASEERDAAYKLSMKIISLGGDPLHTMVQIPPCSNDLPSFCSVLSDLEEATIEKGRKLIELSGGEVTLVTFAEDLILIDAQHLDDLKRMCVDNGF